MKKINTDLLDEAIIFAVNAHKGAERRGKGFPYIVHPMEAVAIVSTMTGDQELLAAAALHDTVEDTDVTAEEIEAKFGKRVAALVVAESDVYTEGVSDEDSWHNRKQAAITRLAKASHDAKIVAMGDKLSNMRAIARDYDEIGDELWQRFHTTDPKDHEWHYRGLAESLSELHDTAAYKEFVSLIDDIFAKACREFSAEKVNGGTYALAGALNGEVLKPFLAELDGEEPWILDFTRVGSINFSGIRALLNAREAGKRFVISGANRAVAELFETTGASKFISVCRTPAELDLREWEKSGEGHTADSLDHADGDAMMKLYYDFIPNTVIEREKRTAQAAFLLGVPTPMPGEIVCTDDGRYGCSFERLANKRSFFRAVSQEPERLEEYAVRFAHMTKKLHETPCDKAVFPSYQEKLSKIIRSLDSLTDAEKKKLLDFLYSVEDTGMCIHGDLHGGNAITDDTVDLFIDMGDFSYGNPLFDLGMLFQIKHFGDDAACLRSFHIDHATCCRFCDVFAAEYFGADTPEKLEEVQRKMMPFAGFQALVWLAHEPHSARFLGFVRECMTYI